MGAKFRIGYGFSLGYLLPTRFAPEELDLQEVMVHWVGKPFIATLRYTPGVIIIFCEMQSTDYLWPTFR